MGEKGRMYTRVRNTRVRKAEITPFKNTMETTNIVRRIKTTLKPTTTEGGNFT